MPKTETTLHLSLDDARAAFIAAQGLPPRPDARLVPVLEETGFIRTLGGVDAYIALRARLPNATRGELDTAAQRGDMRITPAVRGCMYLVARRHVPVCLRLADLLSRARAEKEHEKAGIRKGEVEQVAEAVRVALRQNGPLSTDALRKALPAGTVRSLGEAGKKVGISSPLPGALRRLEFAGLIERATESGRLDTERYVWRLSSEDPLAGAPGDGDPAALHAHMAEVFLRAAGLGTVKDFSEWAGLSQKEGRAAFERLSLVTASVDGIKDTLYALSACRDLLEGGRAREAVAFLPFDDNLVALHGGLALLVDAEHHDLQVPSWGRSGKTGLAAARYMNVRSFVADGRVAGAWEFEPDGGTVVWAPFGTLSAGARRRLGELADSLGTFLSEDVGHGRSFSLDTDDGLRQRAAFVRSLGGAPAKKSVGAVRRAKR